LYSFLPPRNKKNSEYVSYAKFFFTHLSFFTPFLTFPQWRAERQEIALWAILAKEPACSEEGFPFRETGKGFIILKLNEELSFKDHQIKNYKKSIKDTCNSVCGLKCNRNPGQVIGFNQ
jgi:hypothetical protein